jgi:capsular polysaccharide export protein
MKILILEPFYTNFHIELAKTLSSNISAFIFNYGNVVYHSGAKKVYVDKELRIVNYSKSDLEIAKNTKTLYSETLRKIYDVEPFESDFEYMAKYVSFVREYLIKNKIELVMMHNDLRWQHALAIAVCKELKVKYIITERGIFRPDTITIEFEGVNGYSSLPKNKEYYKNYTVEEKKLKSYKVSRWKNIQVNIKFALFILLNKIGDLINLNSKIKNKSYSLSKYIKLFIKQKFSKKQNYNISLPKRYIFVPLQVNTDTQILIHSDFKDMQEFITKVENDFYSIDSDIGLVFKIHPMEKGIVEYKFDSRSIIVDSDTNELVKNSECVVTINSTVGFEAIREYKKVLVLGEAFFKIDGIAICSSKDSFKGDIQNVLNDLIELDNEAIESFVRYLKYEYQVNGNLFNWDDETLEEIKNKIGQQK